MSCHSGMNRNHEIAKDKQGHGRYDEIQIGVSISAEADKKQLNDSNLDLHSDLGLWALRLRVRPGGIIWRQRRVHLHAHPTLAYTCLQKHADAIA